MSPTGGNITQATLEDEEDASSLADMDLTEFKERYRRLIPYMTFYVANNYVNSQAVPPTNFGRAPPNNNQRPQYTPTGANNAPKKISNYYVNPPYQQERFIPSVQYDPKDSGNENDYFTPVRYNSKPNYEDYSSSLYQTYQKPRPLYEQATTTRIPEEHYFSKVIPLQSYNPSHEANYLGRKPVQKPGNTNADPDSLREYYVTRPNEKPAGVNSDYNYPEQEYEPVRYNVQPSRVPQPFRLPDPPSLRLPENANVNLNHIVKSLQLSNQLPEMLNADNIDNSIKTLVEILNILHSGKKNEFPRLQTSVPLKAPQKFPNYVAYTPHYTQSTNAPNIRYQTMPAPIVVPDEPRHFEPTSSYESVKTKLRPQPNYNPNDLNDVKAVEYYTPQVQDIQSGGEVKYQPVDEPQKSLKPQKVEKPIQQHTYETMEDLSDDILEDERLTLPLSTEAPAHNYPAPDGVSSHTQNFPPSSLKYGATRGKPNVDYPAYAVIPETEFSCKEQRYKGFFGDPATGCQVWHYCDLNGGKSSFLCPNGTIFSQVALTCDWWFNVKCESTTQLYVLNERLYKYILPIMPKFPEDFTGPEVDRYLELKFKEMETKLKEKKLKKQQEKDKAKNKSEVDNDAE